MAEKAIKKLDEQLNCAICLETFTDPKLLQCFHAYCKKCLIKLVVRDQEGQLSLSCPTCRHITPIPSSGVRGLQSAFQINEFLAIRDELKKTKNPSQEVEGNSRFTVEKATHHYCTEHADREREVYCEACNELVCYKCVIRGGKHHSHDYDPLDKAFGKYSEEVMPLLEPMEKQLNSIHTALEELDIRSGEVSDQRDVTEDSIHNIIRRHQEILDMRKTELIGQLHQITQGKLKGLATQRDQIETIQVQLKSCVEFVNKSLKTGNHGEVLKMKTTIVKQVKELTTPFQPDILKPSTEADLTLSFPRNVTTECQKYGKVFSPQLPDPLQCYAMGKCLEVAVVGKKSTALLQTINSKGEPCENLIKSFQCELVSEITCTTLSGSIERRGQSQYEISYQPTIKGRHHLHIKVEGQHIRGSPFAVAVSLPVEKLGTPILTIGGIETPWGVTFNQREEVMVTEWLKHCVSFFSPTGKKLRSFGTQGSNEGQFNNPCGVAVDGEGNILVADGANHRIQKFTAEGTFITSVGTKGNGPLQFYLSYGITFNPSNKKVYVIDQNHRVQVLNSDLTLFTSIGKFGSGKGQFNGPLDIACDSIGNVYVTDGENHRIQVFTAEGKFMRMFGRHGDGRGELHIPISITVDTCDRVYVGDCNHRVSVFTSDGQFLTSFGRKGNGPGEFVYPQGLAVDASGVLYVCESGNDRIQVF